MIYLLVELISSDSVHFFLTLNDASSNMNSITNTTQYLPTTTPTTIYVRIDNGHCYSTTSFAIDYHEIPKFNLLPKLLSCNEGFTRGTFDFSSYEDLVKTNLSDNVRFYESLDNATTDVNSILTPSNYSASTTPKEIFVRVSNENCFSITSFLLTTRNCPPTVYNFVSANNDTLNDTFTITGLYNIFLDFRLEIYSRWGRLLWTGNQNTQEWDGYVKDGIGSKNAPDGTYFYLLFLNDIDFPEPLRGFLYLNH
jgi:gliding motility-associated-like protein